MSIATRTPAHKHRQQRSLMQRVVLPVVIILAGLCVLMYPVLATQWNNHLQQQVTEEYEQEFRDAYHAQEASEQVEAARSYNAAHTNGPILDPWLTRISEDNIEYQEYLDQLSGAPAMSQVVIPAIDVKLPLYHGTKDSTLQRGLGHLYGTSLPVGGEGTHSVITGHSGLTNATMFDDLEELKAGDAVYISTFGERMKYQVYETEVVLPDQVDNLRADGDRDLLTLITCTPYGINTHRLLVHAERVPMDPDEEQLIDESASIFQWWMWLLLGISLLVLLGLIWWVYREKRKSTHAEEAQEEKES